MEVFGFITFWFGCLFGPVVTFAQVQSTGIRKRRSLAFELTFSTSILIIGLVFMTTGAIAGYFILRALLWSTIVALFLVAAIVGISWGAKKEAA